MSVMNSRISLFPFQVTNPHIMQFSSAPSCVLSPFSTLSVIMHVPSVFDFADNKIILCTLSINHVECAVNW
jgi:hypothetical protein